MKRQQQKNSSTDSSSSSSTNNIEGKETEHRNEWSETVHEETATDNTTSSTSKDTSVTLANALIKKISDQAPDRALPRTLALDSVMYITKHCLIQNSHKSSMYNMLSKFSRSKKTAQRLFAVDVTKAPSFFCLPLPTRPPRPTAILVPDGSYAIARPMVSKRVCLKTRR